MPSPIRLVVLTLLLLALVGCSHNPNKTSEGGTVPPSTPPTIARTALTAPTDDEVAALTSLAQANYVRITTDRGVIDLELFPEVAPIHVANFLKLIQAGFYDGLTFHRVEPGFVIQGGDPIGNGSGGPGYQVPAEFNDRPHELGTLAMARASDPDSAGSQFYITLAPQPALDGGYTVFGDVVAGLDVIQKIQRGDVMTRVEIVPR